MLHKRVYLLFILLLKNSLLLFSSFYFLQFIKFKKFLIPDMFTTLLKNYILIISMHMINYVSSPCRIYYHQIQLWIVTLYHFQHLQRLPTIIFVPLVRVIKWEWNSSAQSVSKEVPLQISKCVQFANDVNSWSNEHHQQRLIIIVILLFLTPLTHQSHLPAQNVPTENIGLLFFIFNCTISHFTYTSLKTFDIFTRFA